MESEFTAPLNKKKAKQLFFNGIGTNSFDDVVHSTVPQKQELREESEPIDIYEQINKKNELLDQIRRERAMVSTEFEKLIKEPGKLPDHSETVSLEDLPLVVKQAAEAALLQKASKFNKMRKKK